MTLQRRSIALFDSLVRSTASGESVAAWCRRTGTPRSTASKWQKSPQFEQRLEQARQSITDDPLPQIRRRLDALEKQLTSGARPR